MCSSLQCRFKHFLCSLVTVQFGFQRFLRLNARSLVQPIIVIAPWCLQLSRVITTSNRKMLAGWDVHCKVSYLRVRHYHHHHHHHLCLTSSGSFGTSLPPFDGEHPVNLVVVNSCGNSQRVRESALCLSEMNLWILLLPFLLTPFILSC